MRSGNGMKSVSLADGTLSPDLRVNYNFGLVLGVNEFKQEQEYFLQKDYLYNRAFEGYGTVSGLLVAAKWLMGEEVEITVGSGMAIDQFGRPIVVREAQCARLVAWLKRQEEKKQGTIEHHRHKGRRKKKAEQEQHEERKEECEEQHTSEQYQQGEKEGSEAHYESTAQNEQHDAARKHHHGRKESPEDDFDPDEFSEEWEERHERDLRVYIIARYDEYPVGQVPIAGQACNTGDTDPIYSRIQDAYKIDFSWDRPTMPAWDSVRCFAKMMARVRIKARADRDDTDEIIEHMRKLDHPECIPLCAHHKKHDDDDEDSDAWNDEDDDEERPRWFIPADQARRALDRIFTTWVAEVRPKLLPGLLDPAQAGTKAQPDILLAHIDFSLDDDWYDKDPKIEEHGFDAPDNSCRPYLLPTQVVQEMLFLGQHTTPAPALPFVTVSHTEANRSEEGPVEIHLELWFHLSVDPYENRTGFTDTLIFDALFEDEREVRFLRAEANRHRHRQHNVYTSTIRLHHLKPEQRFFYLRLRFPLDINEVWVHSKGSERIEYPSLGDFIRAKGIRFEGYNGVDSILAYVRVFVPPPHAGRTRQTAR